MKWRTRTYSLPHDSVHGKLACARARGSLESELLRYHNSTYSIRLGAESRGGQLVELLLPSCGEANQYINHLMNAAFSFPVTRKKTGHTAASEAPFLGCVTSVHPRLQDFDLFICFAQSTWCGLETRTPRELRVKFGLHCCCPRLQDSGAPKSGAPMEGLARATSFVSGSQFSGCSSADSNLEYCDNWCSASVRRRKQLSSATSEPPPPGYSP